MKKIGLVLLLLALALSAVFAQRRTRGYFGGGGFSGDFDSARTAREVVQHGDYPTPTWTNTTGFEKDVFTFARIKRDSGGYSDGGPWWVDAPDSDLNLSYRLQQMTALKVDPDGRFLRLTDKELT